MSAVVPSCMPRGEPAARSITSPFSPGETADARYSRALANGSNSCCALRSKKRAASPTASQARPQEPRLRGGLPGAIRTDTGIPFASPMPRSICLSCRCSGCGWASRLNASSPATRIRTAASGAQHAIPGRTIYVLSKSLPGSAEPRLSVPRQGRHSDPMQTETISGQKCYPCLRYKL